MSAPEVVAVTHRGDVTADLLVLEAARRGVSLYRFNTEDYPASIGLILDPADAQATRLTSEAGEIQLGQAKGIWIRRPRWPEIAQDVTDPLDRLFARQEAVAGMGGAWRILADRCVSPPDAMQAARWKVAQLSVAAALGFPVPVSVVTTDPTLARAFVAGGPTILKAVAEARVQTWDEERVGSTVEVDGTLAFGAVRPAPILLQRRIDKVADVRVTAVGRRLFPVRISTPADAPLDFRLTHPSHCRYEVIDLPGALVESIHRYLSHWGLRFGAFDLAEDVHGQLWFLECNPAGQWAWLEPPTGLPITGALLDLLLDPQGAGAWTSTI